MLLPISSNLLCQELEPRRWSHLPRNVNFIGIGSLYGFGDIAFDPVLLIEDAEVDLAILGASYIRTFGLFGRSARIELTLPYASGHWEGLVDGVPTSVRRKGFADARMRFSVHLYGAPALKGEEFRRYRASHPVDTTVGASIALVAPTGEYRSDRLINLGSNRWILQPQLGVLHQRRKWQFEMTGSVFLFARNDEFWMGTVREQDPLWFVQGHAIYTFKPGLWTSFSTGYGYGGQSEVNGLPKPDDARVSYWAVSVGIPINDRQGVKFSYIASRTNTSTGSNLNNFLLGWSVMFGH